MIASTNASPSVPVDGGGVAGGVVVGDSTVADQQNKDLPVGGGGANNNDGRDRRQRQPSLLDSLLVGPDSSSANKKNATDAGFGILCNDRTGLCLSATGSFIGKGNSNSNSNNINMNSGVYTSLTKLAQQLQQPGSNHSSAAAAPLITIETEESNLLIKEYDGHAIALKVPALRPLSGGGSGNPGGENQSHPDATSNGGSS